MGDDDRSEGPSLELPSWRLGRRRRSRADDSGTQENAAAAPTPQSPARTEPQPDAQPDPRPERRPEQQTEQQTERPLFVDEAPTAPLPRSPAPATDRAPRGRSAPVSEADAPEQPASPRRAARHPRLTGLPAATLTGVVVGLATVALTWASQRGCGAVRGTNTCGGGPGFLLLVAIMVAMVFLGAGLLRVLRVPGPGSTSFLGVGLLAVITMLFFVDVIFDWWMSLVIPVCAALTYALAHWVTTAYVEPDR